MNSWKRFARYNWIGFAIATHVAGDLPMSLNILQSYESTIEEARATRFFHFDLHLNGSRP
jgi:hypothetical protein